MRVFRFAWLLGWMFITVERVFAWGAVEVACPTHQLIDRQAYLRLQQDPAFPESGFMPLDVILSQEGVYAQVSATLDFGGSGPGPDSNGASPYSWHYYNPLTDRGRAPGAVSQFYFDLLNPQSRDRGKGAAWAAHFLADMSVPYHIVGMPRDDAFNRARDSRGVIEVPVTGPLLLYDNAMQGAIAPEGWGGMSDFSAALGLYVNGLAANEADWFDPWYANGTGIYGSQKIATSSHVLWEGRADDSYRGASSLGGYNPVWRNAAPNYLFVESQTATSQAAQASHFAVEAALFTSRSIEAVYRDPGLGLMEAIRNVATLWRASFSGLRPAFRVLADPQQNNRCRLDCRIKNSASVDAINPAVRVTVRNGSQARIYPGRYEGSLAPGRESQFSFTLQTQPDSVYDVSLETVAAYPIPDLQYAVARGSFRTPPANSSVAMPSDGGSRPLPPPPPVETPQADILQGFLDPNKRASVLRKKSESSYYECYDADALTLKVDAKGIPRELLGTVNRTIISTVKGKGYSVTYTYETRYMPNGEAVTKGLKVDRLTRKTTRMTTFGGSGQPQVKTTVETSHDAHCPVSRIIDSSRPHDYLVIIPHGSGSAPDVPWHLKKIAR